MEINTSGIDRCGCFLPEKAHLQRFRELGGEIITLGSDAHDPSQVGDFSLAVPFLERLQFNEDLILNNDADKLKAFLLG